MSERTVPDTEGALRAYLRQHDLVAAQVGSRVLLGVDKPSGYPVVSLQRVGGGLQANTEALLDQALVQVDVWGDVHGKSVAWAATAAVLEALHNLDTARFTAPGRAVLHGAAVQSYLFLPDDSERARYVVTAQVLATPPPA